MKAALLNLQEVTYCILLPSEACSQYSYLRNYFVLLSWKRVSLMAISTCTITYWCILFWGFVCVQTRERESAWSVPWHYFCTSLVLAYLIIILFPLSHTCSLPPSLPPSLRLPLSRAAAGVTLGSGWIGALFQCCLQLPWVVWRLVPSRQGLRIWGRTAEEKKLLSALQDKSMTMKSVCTCTHMCSVLPYTTTRQAQCVMVTQV